MVNTQIFDTRITSVPRADTVNHHHAPAYTYKPKHKLAQIAMTGCLTQTYYAEGSAQLHDILTLTEQLPDTFIAQTALYCRQHGYMKDMPALLLAILAARQSPLLTPVFSAIIDNGKMLRNFVQIMRSGTVGRRSLGTRPKKLVQAWLLQANESQLLQAAVGQTPSLADIVKMVHPRPETAWQAAFFAWTIGKTFNPADLPEKTRDLIAYRSGETDCLPAVPFQLLSSENLTTSDWAELSNTMGWHALRINLNTLARHGVFRLKDMAEHVAKRLADPIAIQKAKVFPYQLLAAYRAANADIPKCIHQSLAVALEHALDNVPVLQGHIVICPDVSGSMSSPVTGYRRGATTQVRCIDVAALITAALLRTQQQISILPFEVNVVDIRLDKRISVLENANRLAAIGGGGTNCAAPLEQLVRQKAHVDTIILVSDNQSWAAISERGATPAMQAWTRLKQINPDAKLICIDLQPYGQTQTPDRRDILNIGGFSDSVFDVISRFSGNNFDTGHWVDAIERQPLPLAA